jgi:hypothetical protein
MTTAVLPFAPHLLEATLHKVGKDSAVPIENSLDGLRNYLSALNIRNKCKHPLFLALRFDSCIGLLYDSTSVRNPAVPEQLDELVLWATEKSPDDRPDDAQQMLERLREIERDLGIAPAAARATAPHQKLCLIRRDVGQHVPLTTN